jgi:hypothetical protein
MVTETGKDDTNHRLIHIFTDENFNSTSRHFASNYAKDNCSDRLLTFLSDVTHASDLKNVTGVLFGNLFERYCKDAIAQGGKFDVRNLKTGSIEKNVQFDSLMGIKEFNSATEIKQNDGHLYIPKSKNHTAIDFVTSSTSHLNLFNSTTNNNHSVIMDSVDGKSGVYRFVKSLPFIKSYNSKFYFTVRKEDFKNICYPKLLWKIKSDSNKEILVERPNLDEQLAFVKGFEFYAIEIPICATKSFEKGEEDRGDY